MSKGLEKLHKIMIAFGTVSLTEKCDCLIIEKELKALEIIKKKRVNVHYLQECENLKQYNNYVEMNWVSREEAEYHNEILTQEEYDLFKEVLL